jgi:carboxyl-terminal processing protease
MMIEINKRLAASLFLFILSLAIAAFTGGMLVERHIQSKAYDFPLLREAYQILNEYSLKEVPENTGLEYGMIRGMVQALDEPNTAFVEPSQHELQTNQLQGKFGGIGVRIETSMDDYLLMYPFPGSPAEKAGLQEGDRLIAVGALSISAQTPSDDVEAALRGPVNEKVQVTAARQPEFLPFTLSIKREEVSLPSVHWNLIDSNPEVGIVHINVIAETTPDEIKKGVDALKSRGAIYFVLDLRNNSGGLVDAGADTARLFLKSGLVIQEQYRDKPVKSFKVEKTGALSDLPIIVLVNNNTASAAEIVAGALQSQKRALLVGSPTYGKDTIQLVFDLSDRSSLHVTAARWWLPGYTESIAGKGIIPDITLSEDDLDNHQIGEFAIRHSK